METTVSNLTMASPYYSTDEVLQFYRKGNAKCVILGYDLFIRLQYTTYALK